MSAAGDNCRNKGIPCLLTVILFAAVLLLSGCGGQALSKDAAEENPTLSSHQEAHTEETADDRMILSFIQVGKGDAFLLYIPEDGYYMCDTGKAEDFPQISRLLRQKEVTSLRGIFLSHGHKDHTGSLEAILAAYPTERIYLSGRDTVTYESVDVPALAAEYGAEIVALAGGESLQLGSALAQIWIPDKVYQKKDNNNSMVIRFCYGDTSYLMTGDMEKKAEAKLLESGFPLQADVLKLGHHGKTDSTSRDFLERVQPAYGIITGNQEESPKSMNEEIAGRLKACHVQAFYSEGGLLAVDFISDGTHVRTEEIPAS